MTTLQDSVRRLAADLAIDHLPQAQQDQIITELGELALRSALAGILEQIPEAKRDELEALMENHPQQAEALVREHVPNAESLMQAAVLDEVRRFKEFQKETAT